MPDDPDPDLLRELRQRELDGERTLVEIGPFTALVLIAALQTAHDYPLFRRYGRELYWRVVAQLGPALGDDPVIRQVISEGEPPSWRTDY
ncbi:hypothetical protein BS329_38860 [Amycolatopsis coloradensis]|uniref:Uncharacterized protein n=1 Tax=Amycolatopsis coloradensis TaxID=76021 RepID=A0A1R0KES8_9PSEU|nr:hypothetical protein [Amycolatopsis coloradensis]OLZ43621.1 hypothetical protein BS329_38860 [Amycolatopsis coloradensis]